MCVCVPVRKVLDPLLYSLVPPFLRLSLDSLFPCLPPCAAAIAISMTQGHLRTRRLGLEINGTDRVALQGKYGEYSV